MSSVNNAFEPTNDDIIDNNTELNNMIFSYDDMKDKLQSKNRCTKPFLTKYERARIVGYRAEQIASGSEPCVDVGNISKVVDIVEKELKERKIPLIIKRTLPNNESEYWKLEELDFN